LGANLTGVDLVAWLLRQVVVISGEPPCLSMRTVLLLEAADRPAAPGIELFGHCRRTSAGVWAFTEWNPYQPNTLVQFFGDHVVATSGPALPVVYIGPLFLREVDGNSWSSRLRRLTVLFHEAYHIAYPEEATHLVCSHLNLLVRTRVYGRRTGPMGEGQSCDSGRYSSYYLDGLLAELLLANCSACGPTDRAQVTDFAIESYLRVQIELPSLHVVPDLPIYQLLGIASERVQFIPPLRFFDLLAARMEEAQGQTPDWFLALGGLAATMAGLSDAESGHEPLFGPAPAIEVDIEGALRWLALAVSAGGNSYNIPVAGVVPCLDLAIGCANAWWDRIPLLDNGVGFRMEINPEEAFRLARFEMHSSSPARLDLLLTGNASVSVMHVCHLASRMCISRRAAPGGAAIRWPNAPPGEYGVWVDGYALPPGAEELLYLTARW
jgi:hypothetical protein